MSIVLPAKTDITYGVEQPSYLNYRLSIFDDIPPPEPSYCIGGAIVGTKQNFSIVAGKAKAKKTFFVSSLVAAALTGEFQNIQSQSSGRILYIDTEQGIKHCQNVLKRIASASGLLDQEVDERVCFIALRQESTEKRLIFIEDAISDQSTRGVDFIVIDGIRDLVFDINNAEESTILIDKLMEWTAVYDLHIVCVLHENKGNDQLRGHLGTEGQNKAEAVIQVERIDGNTSKVEAKFTRNKEFPAFSFSVSSDGQISMSELPGKEKPIEFNVELLRGIAHSAFRAQRVYNSKAAFNLTIRQFYFDCTGKTIGEKKAYAVIETMESVGIIDIIKVNSRNMEIKLKTIPLV